MTTGRINKSGVDAAKPAEKDWFLWDDKLSGFGLKVTPSGGKVFIFQYRIGGRGADFFESDHGPIPPGARWITIHPNGEGFKDTSVLVVPVNGGSGPMRVIDGARGALNRAQIR